MNASQIWDKLHLLAHVVHKVPNTTANPCNFTYCQPLIKASFSSIFSTRFYQSREIAVITYKQNNECRMYIRAEKEIISGQQFWKSCLTGQNNTRELLS